MNKNKIDHISLLSLDTNGKSTGNVLIVGNAYGIMPYIEPIAKEFSQKGFKPYWFAFSGQEGTSGHYSFKECSNDIKLVVDYIQSKDDGLPIYILAHCAGSLMVLEYMIQNKNNPIKKLIFYGLMYNSNRRRPIAERKLINCDVQYKLSDGDWNKKPLNALSQIDIPILFCHAKDKINMERATVEEMELALSFSSNSDIIWFEEGYDEDLSNIPDFVNNYIPFIKVNEPLKNKRYAKY